MQKIQLRAFLNSAVVDPNDKKTLMKTIIEEGNPRQFELKAMECLEEASRIRARMDDRPRAGEILLESYLEKLRSAATYVSLAAEMTNARIRDEDSNKAGSKASS